jgi:hypothetical protein
LKIINRKFIIIDTSIIIIYWGVKILKRKTIYIILNIIITFFLISNTTLGFEFGKIHLNNTFNKITNTFDININNFDSVDIEITHPKKALYLNNNEIISFILPIIFGPITVEAEVTGDGIGRVEFYMDSILKHSDYHYPYTWECDEIISLIHSIKVKVFGISPLNLDVSLAESEMYILMFNNRALDNPIPDPWITNPSGDGFLRDPLWETTVITGDMTVISAVELNLSEDIVSALFEYSTDENNWNYIGEDSYGGFKGYLLPIGSSNRKMGDEGWNGQWDTSNLQEGLYYIRVTMTDDKGQTGICIKEAYFDPITPVPRIIEPSFNEKVSNDVSFRVDSFADDIVSSTLYLYQDSDMFYKRTAFNDVFDDDGYTTQTGHGEANQNAGRIGDEPSDEDGERQYCAPTAAVNALGVLRDPKIFQSNQNEEGNNQYEKAANRMASHMSTDKDDGTNWWSEGSDFHQTSDNRIYNNMVLDNVGNGLKSYLNSKGVGCRNSTGYEVTTYSTTLNWSFEVDSNNNPIDNKFKPVPGSNQVTFENYSKEIKRNEAVLFAIEKWNENDNSVQDDGSAHVLTGRGYKNSSNSDGSHQVQVLDPSGPEGNAPAQRKELKWSNTSQSSGNFSIVEYEGDKWIVVGMWAVSKKTETKDSTSKLGDFHDNVLTVDTTTMDDGYYLFIVETTDSNGFIGRDAIIVEVSNSDSDNVPPIVVITDPIDGEHVQSPFYVMGYATDYGGSGIVEMDYHINWDGGYFEGDSYFIDPPVEETGVGLGPIYLESYLDPTDNWLMVTIFAIDDEGNSGSDVVTVFRSGSEDNTPPITEKFIGEPNDDGGYIILPYTPITFVAIDDMSGVKYIYYEVWSDTDFDSVVDNLAGYATIYDDDVTFTVGSYEVFYGLIELRWYAVDNSDNVENMHYQQHFVIEG